MSNKTLYEEIERKSKRRERVRKILTYSFLVFWALMVLFPFYWMLLTSVKSYASYNS